MKVEKSTFGQIDQFLDFVPVLSTATNLITLTAKIALFIIAKCSKKTVQDLTKDRLWLQYMDKKNLQTTIKLTIPFLNIFVAYREWKSQKIQPSEAKQNIPSTTSQDLESQWSEIKEKPMAELKANDFEPLLQTLINLKQTEVNHLRPASGLSELHPSLIVLITMMKKDRFFELPKEYRINYLTREMENISKKLEKYFNSI